MESTPVASTPLLIFPCNGNGVEALDCIGSEFCFVGFVDDEPAKQSAGFCGYEVRGREALATMGDGRLLAVPGSPSSYLSRRDTINGLGIGDGQFARVIHPAASIGPRAHVGNNVLIMAGAVVTSNAVIGNHVCILPGAVIHHDAVIEDWSIVGANVTVAGNTVIGRNSYLGSGSTVINDVTIGEGALVGLGSTVIRDVEPFTTVAGTPARRIDGS